MSRLQGEVGVRVLVVLRENLQPMANLGTHLCQLPAKRQHCHRPQVIQLTLELRPGQVNEIQIEEGQDFLWGKGLRGKVSGVLSLNLGVSHRAVCLLGVAIVEGQEKESLFDESVRLLVTSCEPRSPVNGCFDKIFPSNF